MSIYHWLEIWTKQFSDLRWDGNSWQWHLWVQRVWYFCILIFSPPRPVLLVWEWYQKIKFSVKSHSTCPSLTVCGNSWSSSKVTFDCICFLGWWLHYLDQIGRNGPESWFCLIDHISNKTALQLCKFRMITDIKERLPFTVFFVPIFSPKSSSGQPSINIQLSNFPTLHFLWYLQSNFITIAWKSDVYYICQVFYYFNEISVLSKNDNTKTAKSLGGWFGWRYDFLWYLSSILLFHWHDLAIFVSVRMTNQRQEKVLGWSAFEGVARPPLQCCRLNF